MKPRQRLLSPASSYASLFIDLKRDLLLSNSTARDCAGQRHTHL